MNPADDHEHNFNLIFHIEVDVQDAVHLEEVANAVEAVLVAVLNLMPEQSHLVTETRGIQAG